MNKETIKEAVAHIVTDPKGRRRVTLAEKYDPMASAFWAGGKMPEGYSVTPLYAVPSKPVADAGVVEAARDLLASLDPDALNPEQFNAWNALAAASQRSGE